MADEPTGSDLAREALAKIRGQARGRQPAPRRRRGRDERRSGARPDERDPQLLGAAVRQLIDDRGWDSTVSAASVIGRWDSVVGPDIAAHCRPESLDDGVLTLVAESTAWATQLRLLSRSLLGRIEDELGRGIVRSVRVKGPSAPDWRHGPRRVTGRGPRDTYG